MTAKALRAISPQTIKLAVLALAFLAGAVAIVAYSALTPSARLTLDVGEVAPQDMRAPISLTYQSEVLTTLARQTAADNVRPQYDPPSFAVLRQQVQLARNILNYIDNVRHDSFASETQKLADLMAITDLAVAEATYSGLLRLDDNAWKEVDAQVILLLERTMRNPIREDNLKDVVATLPNLVSVNVTEDQAGLIVEVVRALLRPNSFYNEVRTLETRQAAADNVRPVTRSFVQGQIVVRGGAIITEADREALTQLRLLEPGDGRLRVLVGALLAVLLVSALLLMYLRRFYPDLMTDSARLVLIGGLFLLFLAGMRMLDTGDRALAHLYPAAAFTLIVVAITDASVALATTAALAALVGLVSDASLEFAALVAATGVAGVLAMRRVERLNAYFTAGLAIAVVNIGIGLVFGLFRAGTDDLGSLLALVPAGLISGGLAAGLGLVGLYLSSSVLNIPTTIKLLELSQPGQPLLQRLLREAPGTYQHSLQVANLAELAAERIGANAALVRVAALYHDIGKLSAPLFFGENQAEGVNPHEMLNPQQSARLIISHVTEGEKLARRNRLPNALIDFICQHHGTTKALYFYNKAIEAAGNDESKVDPRPFTYPGPRPQTREAALMMLADTSESVVRSKRTRNKAEIEEAVNRIIEERLADGQLDASGLTVSDLKTIREVFVSSLQGVFHPRIAYPPRTTQEMQPILPGSPVALPAPPNPMPPNPAPSSSESIPSTSTQG